MRQFSKKFSINKAKKRNARRLELESKVKEFKEQLTTASNDQLFNDYNKCKEKLESLYDYITDGIILRSRATWYEKGEKSTKYFLNLEKRNKTKSQVRKLINPDGSEETNPKHILANIKSFYSEMYTRRSVKTEKEIFDYLCDLNIPELSHEAMTLCEGKRTVKECWNALDSMGNNKSPGNDGFTKEFYLAFFTDLNQYLVDSLNFSLVNGEFSSSQKHAVITLMEKEDRDKWILKDWRPISLINVDVKIAEGKKCYA